MQVAGGMVVVAVVLAAMAFVCACAKGCVVTEVLMSVIGFLLSLSPALAGIFTSPPADGLSEGRRHPL